MAITVQIDQSNSVQQQFVELINKANISKPARGDVERLRDFLNNHPELWQNCQQLTAWAINSYIDSTNNTGATKELLRVQARSLKDDLGWRDCSSLEQLSIDAVVLAWLRWTWTEFQHASVMAESHSFDRGLYWEKRLVNAQRQYLRAVESLAKVRRLLRKTPELMHDLSQPDSVVM
jgi:hypothetical protein